MNSTSGQTRALDFYFYSKTTFAVTSSEIWNLRLIKQGGRQLFISTESCMIREILMNPLPLIVFY
jgi:hypothetical protein